MCCSNCARYLISNCESSCLFRCGQLDMQQFGICLSLLIVIVVFLMYVGCSCFFWSLLHFKAGLGTFPQPHPKSATRILALPSAKTSAAAKRTSGLPQFCEKDEAGVPKCVQILLMIYYPEDEKTSEVESEGGADIEATNTKRKRPAATWSVWAILFHFVA